jgi:hypothetical protein
VLRFDEQGRSDPDKAREGLSSKGHRQVEVEDVFFLVSELSQMKHLRDAHVFGPDVLGKWRRRLLEALRETMHPPFTPWWSRICVVQEVAVATRVEIVYGGVSAPWSMITSVASKYIEHSSACCAQYTARLPRDEVKVLVDLLQSYFRCRRLPVQTSTRIRGRPSCCRFRQINATLSATKIS